MTKFLMIFIVSAIILSFMAAGYAEEKKDEGQPVKAPTAFDKEQPEGVEATCPVTGEMFKIKKDTAHSEYKGKHYYFCCPACKPKFDADPEKYQKNNNDIRPQGREKRVFFFLGSIIPAAISNHLYERL